jgi:hypothetical protein
VKVKVPIDIITCPEWEALPPKKEPVLCPRSVRIIFHHTAGHHREISDPATESLDEFKRYMRDIQHFQMYDPDRMWNDTGQNFTVSRAGHIGQGRWYTVTAIQSGQMVVSAHCPTQNTQIGIEHEHRGTEQMTFAQREASARLMAWVAGQYGRTRVLPAYPHSNYINTSCPANLKQDISSIVARAQKILDAASV